MVAYEATKSQLYYMRQEILSGLTSSRGELVPLRRPPLPSLLRASFAALSLLFAIFVPLASIDILAFLQKTPSSASLGTPKGATPPEALSSSTAPGCKLRLSTFTAGKRYLIPEPLISKIPSLGEGTLLIPSYYCSPILPGTFVHLRIERGGKLWQESLNNKLSPMQELTFSQGLAKKPRATQEESAPVLILKMSQEDLRFTVGTSREALSHFEPQRLDHRETIELRMQKGLAYGS